MASVSTMLRVIVTSNNRKHPFSVNGKSVVIYQGNAEEVITETPEGWKVNSYNPKTHTVTIINVKSNVLKSLGVEQYTVSEEDKLTRRCKY